MVFSIAIHFLARSRIDIGSVQRGCRRRLPFAPASSSRWHGVGTPRLRLCAACWRPVHDPTNLYLDRIHVCLCTERNASVSVVIPVQLRSTLTGLPSSLPVFLFYVAISVLSPSGLGVVVDMCRHRCGLSETVLLVPFRGSGG